MNTPLFWKNKLAAFLHDPPSKALDIRNHQEIAKKQYLAAGFSEEEANVYSKRADWTAAAADRLPFPFGKFPCRFDGSNVTFKHPLSGNDLPLPQMTAELAEEMAQIVQPVLDPAPEFTPDIQWRARLFAHWRIWRETTTERDWRLNFFPSDTRIPDHSIWHHMGVVSAFEGCEGNKGLRPAFLKLQIGPVQDFIAASKSVRDLWSGSYLLSWLMSAGLKALTERIGPDAVIYPSLFQQPLFDLQWKKDLWDTVSIGNTSLWESRMADFQSLRPNQGDQEKPIDPLLVPNFPNVFLALVPASHAEHLGQLVEQAIRGEWDAIAKACWEFCDKHQLLDVDGETFPKKKREERFKKQVQQFLQIAWVAEPWPDSIEDAQNAANAFHKDMPVKKAAQSVETVIRMATEQMPVEQRDKRYYTNPDSKDHLNNVGLAWSTILQITNWKLDAIRQTRAFKAWGSNAWDVGAFNNKDALNGKEEAVAGGKKWQHRCSSETLGGVLASLFKTDDWVGASTLIKRVWHLAYLKDKHDLKTDSQHFPMPDTQLIAEGKPNAEGNETGDENLSKYFAVLALDGDEIGKWVSGEKMPAIGSLMARPAAEYFSQSLFSDGQRGSFNQSQRLLSPGFHLQFSETLSNFALRVVPLIVHHFGGRLIYAGGDDVLAMLPAHQALECAQALRAAFRGSSPGVADIQSYQEGFLTVPNYQGDNATRIPFPVPGPGADVSVGIAMAHFKHPLQDVVRAAQSAEKEAKSRLGRSAVQVATFKRSGEILKWGCQWESGGLKLFRTMLDAIANESLGARFPHRLCQLLTPYLNSTTDLSNSQEVEHFNAAEILKKEFEFALRQHGSGMKPEGLLDHLKTYLAGLEAARQAAEKKEAGELGTTESSCDSSQPSSETQKPQKSKKFQPIESVIGLCRSVAFANRNRQS